MSGHDWDLMWPLQCIKNVAKEERSDEKYKSYVRWWREEGLCRMLASVRSQWSCRPCTSSDREWVHPHPVIGDRMAHGFTLLEDLCVVNCYWGWEIQKEIITNSSGRGTKAEGGSEIEIQVIVWKRPNESHYYVWLIHVNEACFKVS